MSCYCDDWPPSVAHIEQRQARKAHRCCECGRTIDKGEQYEHVWGVWDGRSDVFNTCTLCTDLRLLVEEYIPCFCWNYGNMREEALEHLREYGPELPGLFFAGARLYVTARQLALRSRACQTPQTTRTTRAPAPVCPASTTATIPAPTPSPAAGCP